MRIHLGIAEDYNKVRTLTLDELIALEKRVIREIRKCEARNDEWGVRHYKELWSDVGTVKRLRQCEKVNCLKQS